jgi:erythromycin esterase
MDLNNIVETIKPNIYNFEDSIFFRYLSQSILWANCSWKYKIGDMERFQLRDSVMADNLIWLIEKYYPDNKVIVWSSNMHILYNNALYKQKTNFVSMGEYVKNKYGNKCYTIVFSSFCQLSDRNTIFQKGGNKCIEYMLHKNKIRYGFLDNRSIPTDSFLHDDIVMRANHSRDIKGKWAFMADGLFFIDTMRSVNYKN